MEMAAEEIGKRFDVNLMEVDFETLDVLPKSTFSAKFKQISEKARGRLIIKEYPTGAASAAHFRALLAELKTKQNFVPDMIIVDYMNICASEFFKNGSNQNTYTIVGSIGKELRALAIEHNAAMLTATQTNRSGVNNSDIDMTSVSDSAGTSMIADWILALISTDELKQLRQIMGKQIKNRYNGTSDYEKFLLGADYSKQKIFDLESDTPVPIKAPTLNKSDIKSTHMFDFDMNHTIQPETSKFDDIKFE